MTGTVGFRGQETWNNVMLLSESSLLENSGKGMIIGVKEMVSGGSRLNNGPPKNSNVLMPRSCDFVTWQGGLEDVINYHLEMGILSWVIQMGLKSNQKVPIRGR